MSLQNVSVGEVFTVRVYKLFNQYRYANTYEVVATEAASNTSEAYWYELAGRFQGLEAAMHLNFIKIDRVVISSYVPDGQPYNPETFISFPSAFFGQVNYSADIVPANMCVVVRKNVTFGRDGRNFYRGVMTENDLVGGFPEATLSPARRNDLQTLFSAWYTEFINNTPFRICLASGTPNATNVRQVIGFVVESRIASKKINNRYFKRNPGVPSGGGD